MDQKPPDTRLATPDNPHAAVDLELLDNTNSGDVAHQRHRIAVHGGTMWNHVMIVCAGFAVMFTTCAFIFAFGVYQALYEEMAQEAHSPFVGQSTALIGLIGTLAIALMSMGGPLAMTWAKLWSPQAVIVAGGWVFGIAYILAGFSQRLWHFALTQGVLLGIGTSMAYVPTMSVAPTWFDQRRGLAMGIIISGSGVGGMEQLRVQNQSLNRRCGWIKVPLVNWRVASSGRFIAQALGCFLQSAGYSTPLFFYAAYARTLGYSAATADNFIAVSNASNFVSRILIGYGADKLGRLNALAFTTLFSTIAVFAFWLPSMYQESTVSPSSAHGLFIVFTILYGSFASAYISLFPASLIELFGVQHFTSVNGVLYLIRGMGALIGTPLTGLLIPQSTALVSSIVYERAGIVCGVLLFAATLACFWVRIEATLGELGRWKA
ncbi:hypothetical protein Aspvir_009624 [Aspergillus viridinutans]|uniref:Major facilitator superfamily (MFS) profile domain-containing protein n=1 Tax=Aspergillus viridinutans TaxID=75553 RepID=A0A9P3C5F2_ASPVI|nr:uncharacterized protein Aspvir_009624 [Aspergillus viridinutans]GIK05511.1 hypothetical protein Aspvir_009624 [Aspergillus viridinutans]